MVSSPTSFEDDRRFVAVRARIDDPGELFVAPEEDPFLDQSRKTSVVDDLVAHLRSRRLRHLADIRLTLVVPAHRSEPELASRMAAALARHAMAKAAATTQLGRINRFEGLARFPWGLLVSLIVLLAVLLVHALLPSDLSPVMELAAPFVTVLIWVSIWSPIESLLYEGWSLSRLQRIYELIGRARVEIELEGPAVTG